MRSGFRTRSLEAASLSASTMMALAAIHDPAIRTAIVRMRRGRAPDSHADALATAIAAIAVPVSDSAVSDTDRPAAPNRK